MISSGWACAGSEKCNQPGSTGEALSLMAPSSLVARHLEFLQIGACVGNFGSATIRAIGNCDNFLIVLPGLGLVSRLFGRRRCSRIGAQPIRLFLECRLEGGERFPSALPVLSSSMIIEFAGRLRHARCHRVLLGLVLSISAAARSSRSARHHAFLGVKYTRQLATCR